MIPERNPLVLHLRRCFLCSGEDGGELAELKGLLILFVLLESAVAEANKAVLHGPGHELHRLAVEEHAGDMIDLEPSA